jgi:hypothetical protein
MRKLFVSLIIAIVTFVFVVPAFAVTYTGRLEAGDAMMDGRIFRDAIPSACGVVKPFPGNFGVGSVIYYETFTYTNFMDTSVCVTVSIVSDDGNVHAMAYLGSFDPTPAGRANNFIGDSGSSSVGATPEGFSFDLAPGATATIVVNTNNNLDAGNYILTVLPDQSQNTRVDDGRINDDNNASYVVYADGNGGLVFFTTTGDTIFSVSASEIALVPSAPSTTTLIKSSNGISVYRLTDGTFQTVGANLHGDKSYVVRFAQAAANTPYTSYEE